MNKGKKSPSSTGSKIPATVPRSSTSSNAPSSSNSSNSAAGAIQTLVKSYVDNTPARLKLIDAFCAFLVVLGVMQFAYCILITDYPFNSFLAGFSATVGQFVLAASLRIQANKANSKDFNGMTPERYVHNFWECFMSYQISDTWFPSSLAEHSAILSLVQSYYISLCTTFWGNCRWKNNCIVCRHRSLRLRIIRWG